MKRAPLAWALVAAAPLLLAACLLAGASGFGLPNPVTERALFFLRLNRVLAGFVVGASLAASGVALQAILRNPLAEPYVLGVSSGAGLGAAAAILLGVAGAGALALPLSAFVLATATLALVYGLASRQGALSVFGLILSGVIVSAVCSSLLMFLVSVAPVEGVHSILWWMLGNLEVPSYGLQAGASALMVAGMAALWLLAPELNALSLGSEMAHHVGIRTRLAMPLGLLLATLTTAAAVSMAGLIGFVGLIVPHVMRGLLGPNHRVLLPVSALMGGVFLALCDAVARSALGNGVEIPVGVVTALLGGPFFLFLLHRRRPAGWAG
jgi:iron complex transport system permease protein